MISKVENFAQRKKSDFNDEKNQTNETPNLSTKNIALYSNLQQQSEKIQNKNVFTIIADLDDVTHLTKCNHNEKQIISQITEFHKINNQKANLNPSINFRERDLKQKAALFNNTKDKCFKEKFYKGRVNFKVNSLDTNQMASLTYEDTHRNNFITPHKSMAFPIVIENIDHENKTVNEKKSK